MKKQIIPPIIIVNPKIDESMTLSNRLIFCFKQTAINPAIVEK